MQKELTKAASLCAASEQCRNDVYERLLRWGVDSECAEQIIERLVSEHLIDELRYARAFTHDRIRYAHWGRIKIAYALRQKKIDSDTIAEAMNAIDDEWSEEYAEALSRTIGTIPDDPKALARVMRRAASHGFTPDEIRRLTQA